jgi:hypothetical protein
MPVTPPEQDLQRHEPVTGGLLALIRRGQRTGEFVIIAGHAFIQNLRRGHYELGIDAPPAGRVAVAFTELARAI